jgi:hypothetical protein
MRQHDARRFVLFDFISIASTMHSLRAFFLMENSMKVMKNLLVASLLCVTLNAFAASNSAGSDFREAAHLHRGGATPAAMAIWKRLAQQGSADAAYNLGLIHQHADGVPYNPSEALRWYRLAADRGDKPAQFQLGLMYQNGEGVAADAKLAHEWYTKHRKEHVHHHHSEQYRQWQKQALALIEERDRRESALAARRDGERVLAELRRRAGLDAQSTPVRELAAVGETLVR